MVIQPTQASREIQSNPDVSAHKLISLLMAGTIERVFQAKSTIDTGNESEKIILMQKIISIINGLRGSLDFDQGGDIALNLDSLYDYMLSRLDTADNPSEEKAVLDEVARLMAEVKSGWDQIDIDVAA